MGQFDFAIKNLQDGNNVEIKPRGNSMSGLINSGDSVILSPIIENVTVGSVVLVRIKGNIYLHLIKAMRKNGDKFQYQIGNNRGGINGWVSLNAIYGEAIFINGKKT